jgi:DNA-binding NarL/FixJ family response regulator
VGTAVTDQIRIAVIDPYPLFRQGIIQTIVQTPGLVLVAEGATVLEAQRAVREQQPDVLVFDIGIPEAGVDGAQAVINSGPDCKLLVLTSLEDVASVARALAAGIQGYILRGVTGAELIEAIRTIDGGQPYITPKLASRLLTEAKGGPLSAIRDSSPKLELSYREQQVLLRISRGLTNKEIAAQLGLNERTIKHYLTQLFKKMRVRNRLQAIQSAKRWTSPCGGRATSGCAPRSLHTLNSKRLHHHLAVAGVGAHLHFLALEFFFFQLLEKLGNGAAFSGHGHQPDLVAGGPLIGAQSDRLVEVLRKALVDLRRHARP